MHINKFRHLVSVFLLIQYGCITGITEYDIPHLLSVTCRYWIVVIVRVHLLHCHQTWFWWFFRVGPANIKYYFQRNGTLPSRSGGLNVRLDLRTLISPFSPITSPLLFFFSGFQQTERSEGSDKVAYCFDIEGFALFLFLLLFFDFPRTIL